MALAGIVLLAAAAGGIVTVLGVVLLAATGISWGLYTAAGRGVPTPHRDDRRVRPRHRRAVGPAVAGIAAGLHVTAEGVAGRRPWAPVPTALAYIAWYTCQRSMSATTAGTVQLVIPILTAAGAVALLGEPLSAALFVAAALVAVGMWLARPART